MKQNEMEIIKKYEKKYVEKLFSGNLRMWENCKELLQRNNKKDIIMK